MRAFQITVLAGVAFAWNAVAASNTFEWKGNLAAGQTIEIKGINGRVSAQPAEGNQVEVTAEKHGRRDSPDTVDIRVVPHGAGVTICAVYPSGHWGRPNECVPGSGGRMSVHDNDVRVDFAVRVPAGVRFTGRTVNGDVEADSLRDAVEAYTVNGGVRLSTAGDARATTVNGSIRASLGRADWTDSREFKTVNGSITLDLPPGINADVECSTLNGSISTDFPLTIQGSFSGRHLNGSIGKGGRELMLKTVNGSINLRRPIV